VSIVDGRISQEMIVSESRLGQRLSLSRNIDSISKRAL